MLEKIQGADLGGANLVESLMTNVVEPVATAVVQFILFVVLAVAVGFILKVVVRLLDGIIKKLPAVKQLNKGLGAVFGVLRGIIVVAVISMLLGIIASFIGNEEFIELVNNSVIVDAFRNAISVISGANV
ncbi:MAG: CvpA family protein, partial [Clostridia bacterium]|nr:CvpA family protein [Clostridia bacterium]